MHNGPDLTPYAGRWVALAGDRVAGVGHTPGEAKRLAQRNRPKERFVLRFVEAAEGEVLPLPGLLDLLRPLLEKQRVPVYLVGGAVRDALLGRTSHDLDFVVPREAVKLAFKVADALEVPAYVLDRERDTGRVVLPQKGTTLDFARFRGPDLAADLRDRDFTINAIALPATARRRHSIIDPCDGMADLAARRVRLTHPLAVQSDAVRALRAIRLSLSLDFTLPDETITAVAAAADQLHTVSIERVRDEVLKLLQTDQPHEAVQQMATMGLLAAVLPKVAALATVSQSAPHTEPVLAHTISVLRWLVQLEEALGGKEQTKPALAAVQDELAAYTPRLLAHLSRRVDGNVDGRILLRLGTLYHDVGKHDTQTVTEEGRIRFLGHDKVGAKITAVQLRRLCLSKKAISHVQKIVYGHMRPFLLVQAQGAKPSRRAVYRFFRDLEAAGLDVGLLALADHLATHEGPKDMAHWQALLSMVAALFYYYFEKHQETVSPPPLLDGRQLMAALHLSPGPEVGRLLRLIEEAQAAGEISTPEEAIQFAHRACQ